MGQIASILILFSVVYYVFAAPSGFSNQRNEVLKAKSLVQSQNESNRRRLIPTEQLTTMNCTDNTLDLEIRDETNQRWIKVKSKELILFCLKDEGAKIKIKKAALESSRLIAKKSETESVE